MQRLAAAHGADFRIFYPHNEVDLARKNISCIKDEAENIAVAPKRLFLQRVAKWPQTPFGWSTILQAWSKGTHMNKRLASAVAFAALAAIGSASAADLPLKTPPMAPAYV